MKIGLATYTPEKVVCFDLQVYYSKREDGSVFPTAKEMQNDFTYLRDAQAIREDAKIVAVSNKMIVTRKNREITFPFDFVCPTTSDFRAKVLDYIEELSKANVLGRTLFFWQILIKGVLFFCV